MIDRMTDTPEDMTPAMTDHAKALLRAVLQLPTLARAQFAAELLERIRNEPDLEAEAAWMAELEHRARRARAGVSHGQDWASIEA